MSSTAENRGPVDLISQRARPQIFDDQGGEFFFEMREALGFDVVFAEEFNILRPYLGRISRLWPVKLQDLILEKSDLADKISTRDVAELDALMKRYARQMLSGRFYEEFYKTTEELAQFFVKRQVPNAWLVSSFMGMFHDAQLEIFFDREARQGRIVVSALRCLLKIMTLTVQIMNRCAFMHQEKESVSSAPPKNKVARQQA